MGSFQIISHLFLGTRMTMEIPICIMCVFCSSVFPDLPDFNGAGSNPHDGPLDSIKYHVAYPPVLRRIVKFSWKAYAIIWPIEFLDWCVLLVCFCVFVCFTYLTYLVLFVHFWLAPPSLSTFREGADTPNDTLRFVQNAVRGMGNVPHFPLSCWSIEG